MERHDHAVGAHAVTNHPESPSEARELVRRTLAEARWPGDRDAAVLVASELVANAICHAGGARRLEIDVRGLVLRVESEDSSDEAPEVQRAAPEAASGRGMAIVAALVDRWGLDQAREGTGKTVWFEMCAPNGSSRLGMAG